jgi:hypothetical protein
MATFYEVFANISEPRIGFRHFGFISEICSEAEWNYNFKKKLMFSTEV